MKTTSAIALIVLLSGCAKIAPGPDAALVIPPDQFVYAGDASGEFDSKKLLPTDDFAFQKLNALGLASAPSLQAAIARIDAARAQVTTTKAARLPEISANGSIVGQRRSLAAQGGSFGRDRISGEFQLGLTALWDADIFGRLRASARAAQARLDASTQDSAAVRLALTTDIAKAVIAHRDASARRIIVQQDLADAQALAAVTTARAQSGVISGLDVARATSLVRDAQSRLTPFEAETAAAVSQLITLTALPARDVQGILRETYVAKFNPILGLAVPSQVLRQRPDIQAAFFRLSAANADLSAAAAARFPRLTLNGTLGTLALAAGDVVSGNALFGTLGASIVGPLMDFGRTASEINRRKANAAESYENYRSAVFNAVGEVESSLAALSAETAGATARNAQRAADADTLAIAQERYRLGLTDFLAVIDAQRRLNISRLAVQSSARNIADAQVQLYRALGGAT